MREIDVNADVGEIDPRIDEELMPLLSSASIACGGHAGDAESMRRTVALARRYGVRIGAHPGYADRARFGRVALDLSLGQVIDLIRSQVDALATIAREQGTPIRHVKPHGALYNRAERDDDLARTIVRALSRRPRPLLLYGRRGSALERAAREMGHPFAGEAFADRRYRRDGSLKPRAEPGAVLESEDEVAAQVRRLCTQGEVVADDGATVPVTFETLCLHSDTASAPALARRIRRELEEIGIGVHPLAGA